MTHLDLTHECCRAWCPADVFGADASISTEIADVDCQACLDAVLKLAGEVVQRKFALVDKFIAECKAKKEAP